MNQNIAKFAVHVIGDRIGVGVRARILEDREGEYCELTPADLHPNEGFTVQFRLGWRSAEAVFIPGLFAGELIARLADTSEEERRTFGILATAATQINSRLVFRINGIDADPRNGTSWPEQWRSFELSLRRSPLVIEEHNEAQHEMLVGQLVVPLFGMVTALIGTEESESLTTGELEGRAIQTISTRYERSRLNREACIQLKGSRCIVCGFDFAETYGPLGIGYIEVHHLKPASTLGVDYRIDVATDLAPFCANCHGMAHREDPPVSIERLREIVEARRRTSN